MLELRLESEYLVVGVGAVIGIGIVDGVGVRASIAVGMDRVVVLVLELRLELE